MLYERDEINAFSCKVNKLIKSKTKKIKKKTCAIQIDWINKEKKTKF